MQAKIVVDFVKYRINCQKKEKIDGYCGIVSFSFLNFVEHE